MPKNMAKGCKSRFSAFWPQLRRNEAMNILMNPSVESGPTKEWFSR
jgi:hypothetical protein